MTTTTQTLTCPNCKTPFEVDERGYDNLVKQVRDAQFEKELARQQQSLDHAKKTEIELAVSKVKKELEGKLIEKDLEISKLESAKNVILPIIQTKELSVLVNIWG